MPINVRFDGDLAILSNVARMMNDPRYVDAQRDVRELLDQGHRRFVLELGGVRETGEALLGLLVTLTRQIRREGGDVVLANVGEGLESFIESMRLDAYWDIFEAAEDAKDYYLRHP